MEVRNPLPVARRSLFLALLATTLVACGPGEQAAESRSDDAGVVAESPDAGASPATGSQGAEAGADQGGAAPDDAAFEIDSVPVSSQRLGAFPFIVLPDGYEAINAQTLKVTRVPFWTGDRLEPVEGKAYMATVQEQQGSTYSELEFERNIAHVVEEAGGVLVTDSAIPPDVLEGVPRDVRVGLVDGWGDVYNNPVQTYVIRTAERTIWVHVCSDSAGAGLIVLEAEAFVPTASLLPADTLKREIDAHGRVAMEVNFAVDKADILPASMPQVEQVSDLLASEPELRLSIDGHTDATGDAAHNQALSEARAKAVVAALVARGIDAARLQARGLGQGEPVADNDTEQGRAKNRRVELVKLP